MNTTGLQQDLEAIAPGGVFSPADPQFASAVTLDNLAIRHAPTFVVRPTDQRNVAGLVDYCRRQSVPFTVRCGGHSPNGYSLNSDGIVVDLRALRSIRIEGDVCHVGAGATWADVYDHTRAAGEGRAVLGGIWPSVGVSGYLMGGGYSVLSRSHGMACDQIVGADVVTCEGHELRLNQASTCAEEREIYWGIKGGGGGNFCIATGFTLNLHSVHSRIFAARIAFDFERLEEVFEFYDDWVGGLPDAMAVYGSLLALPDPRRPGETFRAVRLTAIYDGEYSDALSLLAPLLAHAPLTIDIYSLPLEDLTTFLSSSNLEGDLGAYVRSAMLQRGTLGRAAPILRKHVEAFSKDAVFVVWTHAGGAINRINGESAAFAHRDAEYAFAVKAFWPVRQPELLRPSVTWAYHFFEELGAIGTGAYVNYIDPLLVGWREKYYRTSWPRLVRIKEQTDPHDLLRFQQGISSTYEPDHPDGDLDLGPLFRTFAP